jgi:hypothetical protein
LDGLATKLIVPAGGEGDMLVANNASGYNFGGYFAQALLNGGMSQEDVNKIKIWADYYRRFGFSALLPHHCC